MENKPAREILAARLIELREGSGLTQQELADKLNITRQSLSLYERAERTINIDLLLEISKVFDVSTDYLLGVSDCKTTDMDIREICDFVNLSENAVLNVHEYTEFDCPVGILMSGSMVFNKLCESEHMLSFCIHLSTFWEMNRLYNLYKERLKRQKARSEDYIETESECKHLKDDTDYFKWSVSNYVNEIIDYVLKINQDNKYCKLSSLTDEEIDREITYYSLPSLLRDNINCIEYLKDTVKFIRDEIQNKFKH